jgi:hypothetical protein
VPEIVATLPEISFGALAVDQDSVYLAGSNEQLYRFDKASYGGGDGPPEHVGKTAEDATDLVVDEAAVYFSTSLGIHWFAKAGGRAPMSGAGSQQLTMQPATRMVLDSSSVFWVKNRKSGDPPEPQPCVFSAPKGSINVVGNSLHDGLECRDLAIDGDWVYAVVDEGRLIGRLPKAGGAPIAPIVPVPPEVATSSYVAVEVDDEHVYAATTTDDQVHFFAKEAPHEQLATLIVPTIADLVRLEGTDPTALYFINNVDGGIVRGAFGNVQFIVARNEAGIEPRRIAVDADHVYWTADDSSLRRAPRCPQK